MRRCSYLAAVEYHPGFCSIVVMKLMVAGTGNASARAVCKE